MRLRLKIIILQLKLFIWKLLHKRELEKLEVMKSSLIWDDFTRMYPTLIKPLSEETIEKFKRGREEERL